MSSKLTPTFIAVGLAVSALLASLAQADATLTERIALKFVSATEVERVMLGDAAQPVKGAGGGLGAGGKRGALPEGIFALTADPESASIIASGSAEALDELKKIVRIIDVPKRRIRWTLRALTVDEKLKAAGGDASDFGPAEAEKLTHDAEKRGSLRYRSEFIGANQLPVRLFPKVTGKEGRLSLQARVNGDESVTLVLSGDDEKPSILRRVPPTRWVLFLPEGGMALLVRAELIPDPKR